MVSLERLQTLKLAVALRCNPHAMAAIKESFEDARAGWRLKFRGEREAREILSAARRCN
jgi:hypothetical protein